MGIGGKEPDTVARRLHPGYGCSPDIATHGPRSPVGAGEERRRRGWGGGRRQKRMGIPTKARAGWGCRRGIRVSLMKARVGWGCPGRECMSNLPPKARERGMPE